jgi:prepilin-type processing-associated H-X9-DG protein
MSQTKSKKPILVLVVLACIVIPVIYFMAMPQITSPGRRADRAQCLSNLKQIGLALALYADDYQGHLPPQNGVKGLDFLLRPDILNETNVPDFFHCPKDTKRRVARIGEPLTEDTCSYIYVGGVWLREPATNAVPICWDKPENHGSQGLNVLFNDGHVQWLTLEEWQRIRTDK